MTSQELTKGTNFILKAAKNNSNSSWLGRYANMTTLPFQQMMDKNPKATSIMGLVGSPAIGEPLTEMAMKRYSLGGTTKERKNNLDDADETLQERGYTKNIHTLGKNLAGPASLLGGAIGTGFGALMNPQVNDGFGHNAQFGTGSRLGNAALFGLGGAAAGGLGGYLGGGFNGAITKAVDNNTSTESTERAKKMIAKHPYLTSLPFGNMVGAAFA